MHVQDFHYTGSTVSYAYSLNSQCAGVISTLEDTSILFHFHASLIVDLAKNKIEY